MQHRELINRPWRVMNQLLGMTLALKLAAGNKRKKKEGN